MNAIPRRLLPLLTLAGVLSGCVTFFHDNLIVPVETAEASQGKQPFLITMGDYPADQYKPLGVIHAQRRGVYLLWCIPLIKSSTDQVINQVLKDEALRLGADAVINVRLDYDTMPTFPNSLFTLGTVVYNYQADGLAIKRK